MANKIKWGILSSAKIAETAFVPAIKLAKQAELKAVASESGKAADTAKRWGIDTSYDSYKELLQDPTIDAIYIPLPNSLHKKWLIEAVQAKKHVLVEKPAALTSDEVKEMNAAAKENGVVWMEAFMYQFHPQHSQVKKWLGEGEIGEVKLFRGSFSFSMDVNSGNIRLNSELGGGSLFDVGCYCVHASRFIFEEEPVQVFGHANHHPEKKVDLSTTGILTFENKQAVIDCSFEQANVNRYEVVGTKGSIEVPYAFRPDGNPNNGLGEVILKDSAGKTVAVETFDANQYTVQIDHFSQAILDNKQPSYTPEQTILNMTVIESLYQSIDEGKPVSLKN
ncbi:oxidoreductase [Salipaludibacillus neizhouensis]|uniref:Oxidoreductase n=1 Tax=Salipaludibacillus neizhouensis TaxID=885475 RepID=A0A3A9KEA8_9BACI|nr:Gfo/Idh/MocA family oxidoreductase [Salipaludibacillus neizhouensis]RKL67963.1 oxidoreductase [Salipaludibacillus neizhouensis]